MHYVIVGNGIINHNELVASIDSLWEAAERESLPFWVEWLVTEDSPTGAIAHLSNWSQESGLALVLTSTEDDIERVQQLHSVTHTSPDLSQRIFEGETGDLTVLALIPEDVEALDAFSAGVLQSAISTGILVQDLCRQMSEVQLEWDDPSVPQEELTPEDPVEEPETAPKPLERPSAYSLTPEAPEDPSVTAEDFDNHSLEELRVQCEELNLEPDGDKRKKDSYVKVLLKHYNAEEAPSKEFHYADHGVAGGWPHPAEEACESIEQLHDIAGGISEVSRGVATFAPDGVVDYGQDHPDYGRSLLEVATLTIYDGTGLPRTYPVDMDKAREVLGLS